MELIQKIKDIFYGNRITSILRIIIGLLFIYSSFFKITDPQEFSAVITLYDILPELLVPYASIIMPFLELVTGFLIVIGYKIKPSSLIMAFLMSVFTIAIIISLIRGKSFDCGCFELGRFGIAEEISIKLVIRDIIFLGVILIIYNAKKHPYSVDNMIENDELMDT